MSEKITAMPLHETHVTVRCPDPAELERLDAWSGARELKVTHILLARGRMVSQPMLTLADRDGHERLVPALRAAGFDPVRVKVETVPWATDRPGPGGGYFEHHLKLLLPADYDRAAPGNRWTRPPGPRRNCPAPCGRWRVTTYASRRSSILR